MIKRYLIVILFLLQYAPSKAGNKIIYYFNHPVDYSVSTGVNAAYLNNCVADTLVAYINRARYTLDIAVYDFIQGSYANIATAVNNAYTRGVQVRWIYDGSSSNSGLSLLNSGINTLGSPTSGSYTIMHNKFMVIDGNSPNPDDAIVWTGSSNWTYSQFNTDYNNVVIIQDSALAHAYIGEFNMMWGGTGIAPNLALSKFGSHKTDLGRHSFIIEGKHVELYFSPSDGTNGHIQSSIASANKDLYFGMYTFTDSSDAALIVSKHNSGVYVAGIDDSYSNSYSPYSIFSAGLGSALFKVYSLTGLYHNKFMIVDPSDKCSDPQVLTGSHNWSVAANTKNDENTLIIHSDTAANIYYQSFHANFALLGGSLFPISGCSTAAVAGTQSSFGIPVIFPNPSAKEITISYNILQATTTSITICNMLGRKIATLADKDQEQAGAHIHNYSFSDPGIYFASITLNDEHYMMKVVIR